MSKEPVLAEKPALAKTTHPGNNFDAIRIAAATTVLVSHHYALTGQTEPLFFGGRSFGGLAVTVFFIISGYLVAGSWERDPNIWRFALRRFLRIWPALIAVLALTVYGLGILVTELSPADYLTHPATTDYLQGLWMNIHYVLPGVFERNPYPLGVNGSLWTIPLEVRCYVILGLAGLVGLLKFRSVFLICIALYMAWFLAKNNADLTGSIHYGRELSAFFLSGAALYALRHSWSQHPGRWAIGLGITSAVALGVGWRHTALLILLPYAVIYAGTQSTPYFRRMGRWGDPSYGIYLFAFPIQQTIILYTWPMLGFLETLATALLCTVVMGYASWHLIEKQALKLKPSNATIRINLLRHLHPFPVLLTLFFVIYGSWLLTFWPGGLGEDSLAIILEVESNGAFQSGKPTFWFYFVKLFYKPFNLVELPIAFQLVFCSIVFSRILSWCWLEGIKKTFIFLLIFICLAPHMILYMGALYADAIFSVAIASLIFELWLIAEKKYIKPSSLCIIAITLPFAAFARPNGIIFILLALCTTAFLNRADRIKLVLVIMGWVTCIAIGGKLHKTVKHETLFPIALFETVNFLQPRPMGLWTDSPRVSGKTIEALTETHTLSEILKNYDRDYWDPLIFKPDGPQLLALSRDAKKVIVKEFFTYNLWRNIPAFLGSRINIFLVSALAQGGIQSHDYAPYVLKKTESKSEFRPYNIPTLDRIHRTIYQKSYELRALLWTPFFGIALLCIVTAQSVRKKTHHITIICITLIIQLGGIFVFSIAGEYRYLLPYFALPMALLPITASLRKSVSDRI